MKNVVLILGLAICFGSCQKPLYKYRNYDEAAYKYATAYDEKDVKKAARSFQDVVTDKSKGKKSKKKTSDNVPPGVCVDYACLLLKQQDTVKALQYFDKEVRLYPESKTYVNTLKKNLGL